eukprot:scaffold7.g3751.t1
MPKVSFVKDEAEVLIKGWLARQAGAVSRHVAPTAVFRAAARRSGCRSYCVPICEARGAQGHGFGGESGVVDKLLNRRYAALYPTKLVTYRKADDDAPSKVFALSRHATLTESVEQTFRMRHAKTSTLYAVAAGAYDSVVMHGFTIHFGSGERLAVAFPSAEEAGRWHAALGQAVAQLRVAASASPARSDSDASTQSASSSAPGTPRVRAEAVREPAPVPAEVPAGPEATRRRRAWQSFLHINGVAVFLEDVDEEGEGGAVLVSAVVRAPPTDIFKQAREGGRLSFVRLIVHVRKRESPTGVFTGARTVEVLDKRTAVGGGLTGGRAGRQAEGGGCMGGWRVEDGRVVAQTWRGTGFVGRLCAPRELCLLRTWRKDVDGTYIVLFQSTQHPSVPEPPGGGGAWLRAAPVRVHCTCAGFTVAPLMPQLYGRKPDDASDPADVSPESLITLVFNAGARFLPLLLHLGGLLSEGSAAGRLLWPLTDAATRAVLDPVVSSIVFLREHLEQARAAQGRAGAGGGGSTGRGGLSRFVVRPISTFGALEDQAAAAAPGGAPAAARRLFQRSATTLTYRAGQPPLLALQRETMRAMSMRSPTPPPREEAGGAAGEAAEDEEAAAAWAVGGTCPAQYWSCPGDAGFKLRGGSYLADKRKIPAALPMLDLLEEPLFNVARYLPSVKYSPAPFLFCVQLMVPAVPPVSLVATFAAPFAVAGRDAAQLITEWEKEQGAPAPDNVAAFFRALAEFVNAGDDATRNRKFKLSVGTTPVLLGQKLTTKYFSNPNKYLEVDVDIGSSSVASSVTNLVCGATKSLVIDMGILIEARRGAAHASCGQSADQLPEQLLGTLRLSNLDLGTAAYLDEATGRLCKPGEICK